MAYDKVVDSAVLDTILSDIADEIRNLTGATDTMTLEEMPNRIKEANPTTIISTAEGMVISLDDCASRRFKGLRLLGKTSQNGTPTPNNPVELVCIGESGMVNVTVNGGGAAQRLSAQTPNGLPGLPVTSGGNYTDATGQQWICDEIDFARGKYVQRIYTVHVDGNSNIQKFTDVNLPYGFVAYVALPYTSDATAMRHCARSDRFINGDNKNVGYTHGVFGIGVGGYSAMFAISEITSANFGTEAPAWFAAHPTTFQYLLGTPIETNLTAAELDEYAALHTSYPNTTILNDAGAWMEVQYVADTKLYVDRKYSEVAMALVNNV